MAEAFIIMQIGNAELDRVCAKCIVPALEACGFSAKRVDKHNQGGLLKSEIIRFIQSSDIIVADLTNERPNCYLEVGYAMGIDKFRNLILTAREDHNLESPNHKNGGKKIHFDLGGYDILFWHPDKPDDFRIELEKRIRRRVAVMQPSTSIPQNPWDEEWITTHRTTAVAGLSAIGLTGYAEVRFALDHPKPDWSQKVLDDAARTSTINTFGWPIAAYMGNHEEYRPKPKADGIVAEIPSKGHRSYDYWTLRRNGDFFLLKSLFEDTRDSGKLFFDTRIVRVTEIFLYCVRLYNRLEIDPATHVNIAIRHGGFKNRVLSAANPMRHFSMMNRSAAAENDSSAELRVPLGSIEGRLVELVKQVTAPLFMLIDFAEFDDRIYEDIVNRFVQGRVS